jgi:hypothetical protein
MDKRLGPINVRHTINTLTQVAGTFVGRKLLEVLGWSPARPVLRRARIKAKREESSGQLDIG